MRFHKSSPVASEITLRLGDVGDGELPQIIRPPSTTVPYCAVVERRGQRVDFQTTVGAAAAGLARAATNVAATIHRMSWSLRNADETTRKDAKSPEQIAWFENNAQIYFSILLKEDLRGRSKPRTLIYLEVTEICLPPRIT